MMDRSPYNTMNEHGARHRNIWSIGGSVSLGGGCFTGDLADTYQFFGSFGYELSGTFNRIALSFGIDLMATRISREIIGSNGTLEKGSGANSYMPKGTIGYYLIQKEKFRMKPYVGVSGLLFRHPSVVNEPDYSDLDFNLLTYCGGCSFDFKFRSGLNGSNFLNVKYMFGVTPSNGTKGFSTIHEISVGYSLEAILNGRY